MRGNATSLQRTLWLDIMCLSAAVHAASVFAISIGEVGAAMVVLLAGVLWTVLGRDVDRTG
jgi:hypothetical protein